jgi:hypothetical protein
MTDQISPNRPIQKPESIKSDSEKFNKLIKAAILPIAIESSRKFDEIQKVKEYLNQHSVDQITSLPQTNSARSQINNATGSNRNPIESQNNTPKEAVPTFTNLTKLEPSETPLNKYTNTVVYIPFIGKEGRIVISREGGIEKNLNDKLFTQLLPEMMTSDPELRSRVKKAKVINIELIGSDGSMQIGTGANDERSKLPESYDFDAQTVEIEGEIKQVSIEFKIRDHHPEDALVKEQVDASEKQVFDDVTKPEKLDPQLNLQKLINSGETPEVDPEILNLKIYPIEQKFAMDVDNITSINWLMMFHKNPELLDPKTHEGKIMSILSDIVNIVDKRAGAPNYPVKNTEAYNRPDKWIETVKLLYSQLFFGWIAYYYTLNKGQLNNIKDPDFIVDLTYKNLLEFNSWLSNKISSDELDAIALEDKNARIQLVLDKMFVGKPGDWVKNSEDLWQKLESVYNNQNGPFVITDVKSNIEKHIADAQKMPENFEKNFKVLPIKIGDKTYNVAFELNGNSANSAAGRAYLNNMGCNIFYQVINQQSGGHYSSMAILGEVTEDVINVQKVLAYFANLYLSYLGDKRLKMDLETQKSALLMSYIIGDNKRIENIKKKYQQSPIEYYRGGPVANGTRQVGALPIESSEQGYDYFESLIKALNIVVRQNGGSLDNINNEQCINQVMAQMQFKPDNSEDAELRLFLLRSAMLSKNTDK